MNLRRYLIMVVLAAAILPVIVGVLAVNRPEQERKPMQALIKAGVSYNDVKTVLGDEATDLSALVE